MNAGYAYAQKIVNGEAAAGKLVRASCERAIQDYVEHLSNDKSEWVYEEAYVDHFLTFCSFVRHVKGQQFSGEAFSPEPWQLFIFSQIFGWRRRADPSERRFREVVIEIARKNGKSYLCSVIALYELLMGDDGAEIYSVATKSDQAKIVWADAGLIARKMDGRLRGKIAQTVSEIRCEERSSVFRPLSRDSKSLDGLNPSLVIIDEAGAIVERNVIDVMTSAMGSRVNPLILYITTAYFSKLTAYYEKRSYACDVAKGKITDDRIFSVVYGLDEGDDWHDESCWHKPNPNLGVSLQRDYLQSQCKQADAVLGQRPGLLTKHFNVWQKSSAAWLDVSLWEKSEGEVRREGDCYVGTDLAETRDLCAVTRLWANDDGRYSADFQCWLPESALDAAPPHVRPIYLLAIETGILRLTPTKTTDLTEIQQYIEQSCADHTVRSVCCDPHNATHLVNDLEASGTPVMMVRQNITTLSPAAKQTEKMITDGVMRHEGNDFISWQLENAGCYTDVNENIKIRKGDDPALKIDSIIALILAVAGIGENAVHDFRFDVIEV